MRSGAAGALSAPRTRPPSPRCSMVTGQFLKMVGGALYSVLTC